MKRRNPFDAAEKAWAAIKRATLALTLAFLGQAALRREGSWIEFVARAFKEAGLR